MPFLGIGLHVLVAIFFAVHAIRTRQEFYWLVILFTFPLLGSAVYCLAIYLPASKLEKSAKKTVSAIVKTLDPERELRESRSAFEYTPTAQNQMRLAKALASASLCSLFQHRLQRARWSALSAQMVRAKPRSCAFWRGF